MLAHLFRAFPQVAPVTVSRAASRAFLVPSTVLRTGCGLSPVLAPPPVTADLGLGGWGVKGRPEAGSGGPRSALDAQPERPLLDTGGWGNPEGR